MSRSMLSLAILCLHVSLFGQVKVDLDKSVPIWLETDETTNVSKLKWIADPNAVNYMVHSSDTEPDLTPLATLDGSVTEYEIGELVVGQEYGFNVLKGTQGRGIIRVGKMLPPAHIRGRCLMVIDDILIQPLEKELEQLYMDLQMDGWTVDTIHVSQTDEVIAVKSRIEAWYNAEYERSQSLFLLGHVPVPYSGNAAHDGHNNHQGAWSADVFYGEFDGLWRDITVNNTSPSRDKNKNVPFDGKYDNTLIPSDIDLEIGRVDFNDLPAFEEDEIELTRQYLNKAHAFKTGSNPYPRRALVENNFGGFAEGFGQSGWRNFPTMFRGDSVSIQNYEVVLENDKYLWSYACGGGSYTSCAGVGNTANLWATKELKTVFTMTFGSYFGDWDSTNNFLRSALGCGDILTNAWSGRPVWNFYHMSLGKHIGYSARASQNASGYFYNPGFSSRSAHIALMGDPTLRLHPMIPPASITATYEEGDISVLWEESSDAQEGYLLYRKENDMDWVLLAEIDEGTQYQDICVNSFTTYEYMVKSLKLEHSGSGSYFNTSLGVSTSIESGENTMIATYYVDADMDGYGDSENFVMECALPPGFSEIGMDCDDMNSDIYPGAEEIQNNGIDEDCDGEDLLVYTEDLDKLSIKIYPIPSHERLYISLDSQNDIRFKIYSSIGRLIKQGTVSEFIDIETFEGGSYFLQLSDSNNRIIQTTYFIKI